MYLWRMSVKTSASGNLQYNKVENLRKVSVPRFENQDFDWQGRSYPLMRVAGGETAVMKGIIDSTGVVIAVTQE